MPQVKPYHLPPTLLIPNSPYPLLHYPAILLSSQPSNPSTPPRISPISVSHLFTTNGWSTQ